MNEERRGWGYRVGNVGRKTRTRGKSRKGGQRRQERRGTREEREAWEGQKGNMGERTTGEMGEGERKS